MANKEFHDFLDKTTVADIEAVAAFELLASAAGQNGINVPLNALKTWMLTGNVGGGAAEYNLKTAVDTLKTAVTTSILTLNGKTLTSSADRITANADLYVSNNKVAQEGTAPTFTDVTANQVQAATGQNDRVSLSQNLVKVYVGGVEAMSVARGGNINSITLAGNLAMGSHDVTTAGALKGGMIQAGSAGLTFLANEGSVKSSGNVLTIRNRTTAGCVLEMNLASINLRSTGIYGNQTLVTVESDSNEADPAEIRFVEKTGAINVSSNWRGRILSKGDNMDLQRGSAKATFTDTSGLYGKITLEAGTSNPAGDANSGVRLGATTDLYINAARKLSWRYATASQDGLMSAAQAAQVNKIAAIEEANGNLTQQLGFQTVSDGTNTRTATANDRILNVVSDSGDLIVTVDPNTANAELRLSVTDQMVKLAVAQTLTNKTLLAATNVIEATKLHTTPISTVAPADNQILKFDAVSGKWQAEDENALVGDPVFTKGTLGAPSVAFQGEQGATSGIFHKMSSPYDSAVDGVAVVQNGQRSALFSEDGVTVDGSMLVQRHVWAGVGRTTEAYSDLVFRAGFSGIRGNSVRKSIIFKCAQRDVVEMTSDQVKLNAGLSFKVRFIVDDEELSPTDSVVLCSGNCKLVTLPNARTSTGHLLIIGAGAAAGSATATGGADASYINIRGYTGDGGITYDLIDGKKSGVRITVNETAMLVCDGSKWMRLGGVGPTVGQSSPAETVTFTKLMLNFTASESYGANPSGAVRYIGLDTTFSNAHGIGLSTSLRGLKDADSEKDSGVSYQNHISLLHSGSMPGFPAYNEGKSFWWVPCKLSELVSGNSIQPYFSLNDLPAGSYQVMVLGGYPGFNAYGVRLVITEADAITPGAGDVAYDEGLSNPVGSFLARDKVRVIGDTGPSVNNTSAYQLTPALGQGLAMTSFNVGAKQNVRFYITQNRRADSSPYANLQAFYLVKTS